MIGHMTAVAVVDSCQAQYARVLTQFPRYAVPGVQARRAGERTYTIFGSGDGDENGMRTLGNFAFASALLAARADELSLDAATRDQTLDWARSSIGYMCATHRSSSPARGVSWGQQWQSAWWSARMALGARLVWHHLDDGERSAVRALVVSECDRFTGVPARTGLFRDSKGEENAWDCEILAVACAMFPGHATAGNWRATLIDYAINSISAPQDHTSRQLVDGRPVAEQVYTTNVHSDFTIENHGPYHFCYVASTLHSLVWAQYALRAGGADVPEALSHNVRPMWARAVTTFLDNRFAYPGGQDWARYAYGMYFIQPVCATFARHEGDEIAGTIERLRLDRFEQEQTFNGDGSFFGRRVTRGIMSGQHAKYETDCFANVGLAYLIRTNGNGNGNGNGHDESAAGHTLDLPELRRRTRTRHVSTECGFCYARGERLFASFCWHPLNGPYPLALFVPDGCDDLCEWTECNFLGTIVTRHAPGMTLSQRRMITTDRGFHVEGRIMYRARGHAWRYDHDVLVELLEDEGVMVVENRFRARQDLFVAGGCGMRYFLPNDIFNDCRRRVHTSTGQTIELKFAERGVKQTAEAKLARKVRAAARKLGIRILEHRQPLPGTWVNIDDLIGIVRDGGDGNGSAAGGTFSVVREHKRNAPWASLYCERVELGAFGPRRVASGQDVLTSRYLLVDGDRRRTADVAANLARYRAWKLRPYDQIQ